MTEIGVAHVQGLYHHTDGGTGSFVQDGAYAVHTMLGAGTIELWLGNYSTLYSLEPAWSAVPTTLKTQAQLTEFSGVFAHANLTNFILKCFTYNDGGGDLWKFDTTNMQTYLAAEYTEIYDLAVHLLSTYSGKNFVIMCSELDWVLNGVSESGLVPPRRIDYALAWNQTRQRAVRDARHATNSTSTVQYAVDVNRVHRYVIGNPSREWCINKLLPRMDCDLVGYSAYDIGIEQQGGDEAEMIAYMDQWFPECLDRIMQASGKQVFISECGIDEIQLPGSYSEANIIDSWLSYASAANCPYFIFWEIWNNEPGRMFGMYDATNTLTASGAHVQSLL